MKVLLCTTAFDHATTGSGTAARMIASVADDTLHIEVLSEDTARHHKVDMPSLPGISTRIPLLLYIYKSRRYWNALQPLIGTHRYDVVLFNDIWMAFAARKFLRSSKRNCKVIAFLHDDNTLDMEETPVISGRRLHFWSRRLLERRVVPHLDAILTNSDYMVRMIAQTYAHTQIHRLYYCAMDYAHVAFKRREIDTTSVIRVLFIKQDFERGGLLELISALKLLQTYRFHLTIVSQPFAQLNRKLGGLINNTAHLTIDVKGSVTKQEQLLALYDTHDLLCVPSRREALGLVHAEAMATGTPVVATPVGGIPEVLDQGRAGTLARGGTPESIAEAIVQCLSHPVETRRKVEHGSAHVMERFSVDQMRAGLKHILQAITR